MTGGELAIIIDGRREDWPGRPRTRGRRTASNPLSPKMVGLRFAAAARAAGVERVIAGALRAEGAGAITSRFYDSPRKQLPSREAQQLAALYARQTTGARTTVPTACPSRTLTLMPAASTR